MAGTTDISLVRDRDAQAAIRGFVYQVDLTILRWLKLDDADLLLPERAEDIDIIAQWMNGGDEQLLEQVKNLSGNVTLNTPAVRGALAGFYEHRAANPGKPLSFRFSTNAEIVRERTSHFDDKVPGIQAWNETRTAANASATRIASIRKTLAEASKPDDLATQTWDDFIAFVNTAPDAGLIDFVRTVEFSCGLGDDQETKLLVIEQLTSGGYCTVPESAEPAYLALFHHVMRLLCGDPPRQLRRANIAPIIEAAYPTSPRVALALRLLSERVTAVETELREHARRLTHAEASLNLSFTTPRDLTTPPPAPAAEIDRTTLADRLIGETRTGRLVAVTGQLGMGKTQLIRLACARLNRPLAWLRLRGAPPEEASLRIARVIAFCEETTVPEVLVLDDMPPLNFGSEDLRDRLARLVANGPWNAVRIISSSAGVHSTQAIAAFAPGAFVSFAIPNLDAAEAKSYVQVLGGALDERAIQYLLQFTGAHPQMFVAVCRYLADNGWTLQADIVQGLLERRFADGLTAETAQRFIATVKDESARELVHRMRVCVRRAGTRQLQALSSVDPIVNDPLTKVATLDGVWLQQDRAREWVVSPLLQSLPAEAVPEARRIACHAALAHSFDDNKKLNAGDVRTVLTHMREGRLVDEFVDLYKTVASEALARSVGAEARVARFILQGLSAIEFPDELAGEDELVLSALRLAIRLEQGAAVAPEAVARIVAAALPDTSALLIAITLGFRLRGRNAMRLFQKAFNAFSEESELRRQKLKLFMVLCSRTENVEGVDAWLDMLADFSPQERTEIESDVMWPGALIGVFEETRDANDTATLLAIAARAIERANTLGMPMLRAASTRAYAFALAETDHAAALEALENAVEISPEASAARALLLTTIVQLAVRRGQDEKALAAATSEKACSSAGIEFQAAQCGVRGAVVAIGLGQDGVPFALHAVEASKASEYVPPGFLVRALGELGIAEWVAGREDAALHAFVDCGDRLLTLGETDEEWKQLIPITVHVLNYVAAHIRGITLTKTIDGSSYPKPTPGQFFNADEKHETEYRDDKPLVLAALVVALAGRIGNTAMSERAASRFADRLHTAPPSARVIVAVNAGPYMASRGLIQELITCAWSSLNKPHPAELPALPKNWDDRDQSVLFFGFPQSVLGTCLGFLESPHAGHERASELAGALRELDTKGSNAGWSKVAALLELVVDDSSSLAEVVRTVQSVNNGIIQSVLMLLSSFHRQATPEFSARTQALALPSFWPMFQRELDSADILLVPLLRDYWRTVVDEQPYRFRRAEEVASELERASSLDSISARVYALLRSVLDSLGVAVQFERSTFVEGTPSGTKS